MDEIVKKPPIGYEIEKKKTQHRLVEYIPTLPLTLLAEVEAINQIRATAVMMLLIRESKVRRRNHDLRLTRSLLDSMSVERRQYATALRGLETAGLIALTREPGQGWVVRLRAKVLNQMLRISSKAVKAA